MEGEENNKRKRNVRNNYMIKLPNLEKKNAVDLHYSWILYLWIYLLAKIDFLTLKLILMVLSVIYRYAQRSKN